jgi:hypothetical protein
VSELLLAGLILVAALACPSHTWWMHRRGRGPTCCPPREEEPAGGDLRALRARRRQIEAQLSKFELGDSAKARR